MAASPSGTGRDEAAEAASPTGAVSTTGDSGRGVSALTGDAAEVGADSKGWKSAPGGGGGEGGSGEAGGMTEDDDQSGGGGVSAAPGGGGGGSSVGGGGGSGGGGVGELAGGNSGSDDGGGCSLIATTRHATLRRGIRRDPTDRGAPRPR